MENNTKRLAELEVEIEELGNDINEILQKRRDIEVSGKEHLRKVDELKKEGEKFTKTKEDAEKKINEFTVS
jgi:chromosome segregation ATPase